MHQDIERVSYSEETIAQRVAELGVRVSADYRDRDPILLGILKGSFIFLADLARTLHIPCEIQFMKASSYGSGTSSSGTVNLTPGLTVEVSGRHVLIVEDILDSGRTLELLTAHLETLGAASVEICVLLDKIERREVPIAAKYIGFTCPSEFYVGYGLDYAERYRHLPYIGVLKPEIYS
ncbi:MAG: hypoxanthine phosphoribosyltransferase [Oscillospiraceae bacterium]|jgi:hypoxanthine phosphoribosyltransferase|nr:hypoxanthine phosphoribosyltransferase [Oscillospiraceae bacterium]